MGNKYDKEFMMAGKEVNEIADQIRMPKGPKKGNNKKKVALILLLLFLLLAGAGVGYFMYSQNRLNMAFYLRNVDASIKVSGVVSDRDGVSNILVDGKNEAFVTFEPENPGIDGILNKNVSFDAVANIKSDTMIQFFYEIENRSKYADMLVTYYKGKSDDDNFRVCVYYKTGENEVVAMQYYCVEGKYYYNEEDIGKKNKGMDVIELNEPIRVTKESKMSMRVEMYVYNRMKDANCNCNFSINMVNDPRGNGGGGHH